MQNIIADIETAIDNRDIKYLQNLSDGQLNEYTFMPNMILQKKWKDALELYRNRPFRYWSWIIKNQFTVYENESSLEYANLLFSYCPETQRRSVMECIVSHSSFYKSQAMATFMNTHRKYLAK